MPPRKRRPCRSRGTGPELNLEIEWYLTWGVDAGNLGPQTLQDQQLAWETHGQRFTTHWIEHQPGSRPGAWHQFTEGVPQFEDAETCGWGELRALQLAGVVDDAEAAQAEKRIKENGYRLQVPSILKG